MTVNIKHVDNEIELELTPPTEFLIKAGEINIVRYEATRLIRIRLRIEIKEEEE